VAKPVIIEAAINGATTKAANPHVPITAGEITAEAFAALDAGAAIVHAHCSPPGGPDEEVADRYLEAFEPVWAERPGALLYPTANFGAGGVSMGHLPIMAARGLRIGLLDPGSVNLGRVDAAGLPTGAFVYSNSFDSIAEVVGMHSANDLGISLAIYEPGFLRTALMFESAGLMPPGSMLKFYLSTERGLIGAPFGLPPTAKALEAYLELLGESEIPWAISVAGGDLGRSEVAKLALDRGGHLHLGLEFYAGNRTPMNVELIAEAVALCAASGRPVATHDDACEILGLN
jgi:3-keto-5-aminohexanoate cleavage enzyme